MLVVSASLGLGFIELLVEYGIRDFVYLCSVLDGQILGGLSSLNG